MQYLDIENNNLLVANIKQAITIKAIAHPSLLFD